MIVYKDIFTGDELVSDAYPLTENGPILEVECKMVTRSLVGTLAGDEGSDAGEADEMVTVNNVVDKHNLAEITYDKKSYTAHIKDYLKKLADAKTAREDQDLDEWRPAVGAAVKEVMASFDDWKFFTGETMPDEGMVVLLGHRKDGTPYLRYFRDGLEAETL